MIWEVKTDDGLEHDKDNTYTWHTAQSSFIAKLNTDKFGGSDKWRLPTIKELSCIVDSSYNGYPLIDTTYFPRTKIDNYMMYWSSTTTRDSEGFAWRIDFYYGFTGVDSESDENFVRAVRSGQ